MSDLLNGKLDNNEIRQKIVEYAYSSSYKPTPKLVDSILDQFWFHDFYNSFLSDEVYLNYLLEYLNKEKLTKFSRFNFYHYLFEQIVQDKQEKDFLIHIALDFEKHLTNSLVPSDYENLLKTLNVPKDKFDIQWMVKYHLGKIEEREDKTYFTWEHHTLTEFLVADYLLQASDLLTELKKLVVLEQDGVTAFITSWSGVLRFLLESSKGFEVYTWFIGFLEGNKENIDDNLSELITFIDIELSKELKTKVFDLVYGSYFNRSTWIPVWVWSNISKFIDEESYKRLNKDIEKGTTRTETFVRRGNVEVIIGSLIEHKSPLINKREAAFWEKKLIDFVNNPDDDGNGVIQRHGLYALAKFKKTSIIPLVDKVAGSTDTLLRDEFIQFCIATNPNSKHSIDHFINGMKQGADIYARHGLYMITKKESIKYLLNAISEDDEFWKAFFEHESIFDKDDGDKQLVTNISDHLDNEIFSILKKIIFRVFQIHDIYQEDKSSFVRQIVLLINSKDSNFIFEILDEITKQADETKSLHLFFDYEETIAILLTSDKLDTYFEKVKTLPSKIQERATSVVYIAKRTNNAVGEDVYKKAIELKKIKPVNEKAMNAKWERQQAKSKLSVIQQFQQYLEPSPGKYFPEVFKYYLHTQKELDQHFKNKGKEDKERLIKLAMDEGIAKINPQEFKVTIPDKNVRHFTWSAVASYYGDVLSIVKIFAPEEIIKYRKNIIDFIPYAYSDDMSLIIKLIDKLENKDLDYVNQVMGNKKNDTRYLIPGSYIYLVGHYAKKECKLPSALPILKSFIGDEYIPDYEQKASIEVLCLLTTSADGDTRKLLNEILKDEKLKGLSEVVNASLIQIYKDEKAIDWRINEIKKPLLFKRIEGGHSPGAAEMEIDWMAFAKPIINLGDEKFLYKLFELLDYSFVLLEEKELDPNKKDYWEYINYLWRIVTSYVENLKEKGSFIPVLALEAWVKKHAKDNNYNWLQLRVKELKNSYINYIRPFDKLSDGIDELNKTNIPAAKIAYFLFKSQFTETKLKDFIVGLNYFLEFASKDFSVYKKAKTANDFKEKTLGQLIYELKKYQSKSINKLISSLSLVHEKRNEFTHELFMQNKDIRQLGEEAIEYTKNVEQCLKFIQEAWKEVLKLT
jgi:hypothetical protein